jgi:hypothetical protein
MTRVKDLMGKATFKKGKLPHRYTPGSKVKLGNDHHTVTYPIKHGGKFK